MALAGLLETIILSNTDAWFCQTLKNPAGHCWTATFKEDISIKLQWGRTCIDDFSEPWTQKFLNRAVSSEYADLIHQGIVVLSDVYVSADGGRALLPMPTSPTNLEVPQKRLEFVAVLNALSKNDPQWFGHCIELAGMKEVDTPWPQI
jgi:hypothetical protein